jgi:hypothetical protein
VDAFHSTSLVRVSRCLVAGGAWFAFALAFNARQAPAQYIGAQFVTNNTVSDAGATATGATAHASGQGAVANGENTTAVGTGAQATAADATAVGSGASAAATASAFGRNANAAAADASAFGINTSASQVNASAFGTSSIASGTAATAVGAAAQAAGTDSSAFGVLATATATNATAIGRGTSAAFLNSTAIGANATATRAGQMVFGTSTNTYTAAGIASDASRAAQTGTTQLVTSDASGNLATTNANDFITGNEAFQDLQSDVRDSTEGVAMAMAMAGTVSVLPDNKAAAVSANWGNFEGENAGAISGVARLQGDVFMNAGFGFSENTTGGRAGLTFAW